MPRHPVASPAPRPIVTLTTDFGTKDFYVSAMKAVLIRYCESVRLIDVTHEVPRHDVLCGSITLERAIEYIAPDELVEATPKSIRLRKRTLNSSERNRERKRLEAEFEVSG